LKLNIGCGPPKVQKKKGYVNMDINPLCKPDVVRDVSRGLPYSDGVVDEIICEHVIEHLDDDDFVFFFNECHRVLKLGNVLEVAAPYYMGKWAYIDPTHKRLITEFSFDFFLTKDYNSVGAGVTGWFKPLEINITPDKGEIRLRLEKADGSTNYVVGRLKNE